MTEAEKIAAGLSDDEEWREIPGSPGYEASNMGRVRNSDGKILHQHVQQSGHRSVYIRGHRQNQYVHRVVLSAFDRQPEDGEIGRHLNDDSGDNRIDNLKWGTLSENAKDRIKNLAVKRVLEGKEEP